MGEDGCLSKWLCLLHDRYGTPYRAVVVTGVAVLVLVGVGVGIELLAQVASFMFLVTYGLVHVSVTQLRRDDGAYDPEFTIPSVLYPAVPVVGLLATLAIITRMDRLVVAGGVVLMVAGAAWYVVYIRPRLDQPAVS